MYKCRIVKNIIIFILLFMLFSIYVDGSEYIEVKTDCISSCSVYCYVPEEYVIYIPRNAYGECKVVGNVEASVECSNTLPINYLIKVE